ncbi:unnamed protein product [Oikopleura dioica]|uniref:Polyprenal reductase n=1 Tax=Oikopleura dioica TaxID=34765 RepID=E4WW93_OIKDI|nr:unnamed protein product [Oikopleura dioica]
MELYFIDCIWILVTIASVAITSPKIITNNILFQQLATFGKTRVKKFPFDVPKAWFSHFYVLGSCFLSFLLYRWCLDGQPSLPEIGLMSITMTPIFDLRLFLASSSKHKGVMRLLVVDFDERVPLLGLLVGIHLMQRLLESLFISKSKNVMSIAHYALGHIFYLLVPLSTVASLPEALDFEEELSLVMVFKTALVLFAAIYQHFSIQAMASLRADPNAQKNSCPPQKGVFTYIMSPTMASEILFYLALLPIGGFHMFFPFLFTLVNQSISAKMTLEFYNSKFGTSKVAGRKALVPFLF